MSSRPYIICNYWDSPEARARGYAQSKVACDDCGVLLAMDSENMKLNCVPICFECVKTKNIQIEGWAVGGVRGLNARQAREAAERKRKIN